MNPYNIDALLQDLRRNPPRRGGIPHIGITANLEDQKATLMTAYCKQVEKAGGIPVILCPADDVRQMQEMLRHIDGLILSGGADHNPLWMQEEPSPHLHGINALRDSFELPLTRLAYEQQIPILGICRGIQTLAIALGGHVAQDIATSKRYGNTQTVKHDQQADRWLKTHSITIDPKSILAEIYADNTDKSMTVNSLHHQAVDKPGDLLCETAWAADGVVEAVESKEHKAILGVQWHPEWLGDEGGKLFKWIVEEADCFAKAKRFHAENITLDSHCDTPMFFPQGVRFMQRDPRILYDIHKMHDGRMDAVTMVAYLPQPKGLEFAKMIDLKGIMRYQDQPSPYITTHSHSGEPTISPFGYANLIFDKIERIVSENKDYLSLARTKDDIIKAKKEGKKSILLGIENGLALEGDPQKVEYFVRRGVSYITLCHNGDNDLCDSARGEGTHGGVSQTGEAVIRKMNEAGVLVDLSHAAESTFYDALQISSVPIVCSHSNCKALCDVPRNLSDAQMKALAEKGGVMQITLYNGFLKNGGQADIYDALAHLNHAIDIMGTDAVGIGTDFDGDGGILGLKDASELIQFTMLLLKKRFNEEDIKKIWGENWLRVLTEAQNKKK